MSKNARILSVPEGLAFYTPYDIGLLTEFKAVVPASDRRWDGAGKRWLVAVGQLPALERLCARYDLPVVKKLAAGYDAPQTVQKIIQVRYIGAPKERADGSITASGYADGDWTIVFPQDVLHAWFDGPSDAAPTAATTYYGILGAKRGATDEEIRRAHRVMVKRWHPDINRDPDAGEMMKRINEAYAVLADARHYKNPIHTIYIGPEGGGGAAFLQELAAATGGRPFTSAAPGLLGEGVNQLLLA